MSNEKFMFSPQDYLDMVGLSAMFPRVEVFLIQGSPVDMLETPPMDGERVTFIPIQLLAGRGRIMYIYFSPEKHPQ